MARFASLAVWTLLERAPRVAPGAWSEASVERAHFLEAVGDGWIIVEFLNGEIDLWPLSECRTVGV